jgi:hypothetical protein
VDLPVAIGRGLFGYGLKCGFNGFEGDDLTAISAVAQRRAKLANVCAHVDDYINAAIFNEVDEIPNAPPPEMDDAEPLVDGPNDAIHRTPPLS